LGLLDLLLVCKYFIVYSCLHVCQANWFKISFSCVFTWV
jgi:hypothetical protein